jgi:hypothetical protein
MSDDDGSFLGGLEEAASGLYHAAGDVADAEYDAAASTYHGAAAGVDAFLGDREGTASHMDAADDYAHQTVDDLDQAGHHLGITASDPILPPPPDTPVPMPPIPPLDPLPIPNPPVPPNDPDDE